ncbi:SulP family inorganic anion transporter [Methylosoma difficile]
MKSAIKSSHPSGHSTLLADLKSDIPAGIAVFLVAIPLSLGIALASGAPLISGLVTGIVGGLLVALLSGSALGISGTAAGLTVIVLASIQELGFESFLLAVVLAGLLQVVFGLLKAGVVAYYFPSSVINGMLSGIGIIILLKQIPHAIGYDADYEGDIAFFQADHYSSFSELLHMLAYSSPTAIVIAAVSLAILILWELPIIKQQRLFRNYQGVLLAVMVGVVINALLQAYYPALALQSSHLVALPVMAGLGDFANHLHFPDFNAFSNPAVYVAALTLALVASLETLLSVEAVDKLDPYRRITPTDRELLAQGLGNVCCGLLGGLPLTQVIVRSSFNIQSGARTRLSALVHGGLLLFAVAFIPDWLNKIPLATLAAILLVVGYKLANPQALYAMYKAGLYHFIPFCATIIGLVFTDMLLGLVIGLTTALFSILLENYRSAFYFQELQLGNKTILRLSEQVTFLNKASIKRILERLPPGAEVVIDATRCKYIDYDVYEIIEGFRDEAAIKGIGLTIENLRGFGSLAPIDNVRPPTYNAQQALTPAEILAILKEGNQRFVNNLEYNRNLLEQINDTQQGQYPIAIILSCMDSRTSVELIFDQGLGDVFSARVAGNIVNDDMLGSMEFACKVAGSKLIVVLGHSHCGAIKGACADVHLDHLTGLLAKIKPAVEAVHAEESAGTLADKDTLVQKVADKNVQLTVAQIRAQSPLLKSMLDSGEIGLVGAMYDIETGKVEFDEIALLAPESD